MKLEMLRFFSSDFLERLVFVLYFGKNVMIVLVENWPVKNLCLLLYFWVLSSPQIPTKEFMKD